MTNHINKLREDRIEVNNNFQGLEKVYKDKIYNMTNEIQSLNDQILNAN